MEAAEWLDRFFPGVPPDPWGEQCWVGYMKTRSAEHNPPVFWLGRALDAVDDGGARDVLAARLRAVHGEDACGAWDERDERVQDVLSEACAFAWAAAHLGPPRFEPSGEDPAGPLLVRVDAHDAAVAPRRLRPVRTLDDLVRLAAREVAAADAHLPRAAGRIVYLDVYFNPRMYAQDVGYHAGLTEPLRAAARHLADERRLGLVLTRPFEWGRAIEAHY